MIFRKFHEFLEDSRINENLKAARAYLGVTTTQALEQEVEAKNREMRERTKARDFEGANAAKAQRKDLEDRLFKAEVLDRITAMLGPSRQSWIYAFTKFYFECYKDTGAEDRIASLKDLKDKLEKLDKKQLVAQLPLIKANPGSGLANYADIKPEGDGGKNGLERLVDDISQVGVMLTVNKFISELPGEFTVTNKNARDHGRVVPSLKDAARKATGKLKEDIVKVAVAFEELSENPKDNEALKKVFFWQCKRYRSLNELVVKAYEHIESSAVKDVAELKIKIHEACVKFGKDSGAEIVYDERGICVFEVKSFPANVLINSSTKHCIKDSYAQWEHYVSADDNFNKQYYIWDFNQNPASSHFIIGVTVGPKYQIVASHLKLDEKFANEIKEYVKKKLRINFEEVFLPMDSDDINAKKRRVELNHKLCPDPSTGRKVTMDEARQLIKDGADPNTNKGQVLITAVKRGDIEFVRMLIEMGAKPSLSPCIAYINEDDVKERSSRAKEMVNLLADNGADPSALSGKPLRVALMKNNYELAELLIERGAKVDGDLIVFVAGSDNDMKFTKLLIKHGAKPTTDSLAEAVKAGNFELAELMIKHGARPEPAANSVSASPLAIAISKGSRKIVDLLIKHGARLGHTGLLTGAIKSGDLEMVRTIIENGADPSKYPCLAHVTKGSAADKEAMVKLLISHGADLESGDGQPMQQAVKREDVDLVRILLDEGADPNGFVLDGTNSSERFREILKLLADKGCLDEACIVEIVRNPTKLKELLDNKILDPDGDKDEYYRGRPLREAIRLGQLDSVRILMEAGAKLSPRKFFALKIAFTTGRSDIAEFVVDKAKSTGQTITKDTYDNIISDIDDLIRKKDHKGNKDKMIRVAKELISKMVK